MAVRPFWIDAKIDGKASPLSGGPRAKDGGLSVTVKQRDHGSVTEALRIECDADPDGRLRTTVYRRGEIVASVVTTY